MYLCKLFLVLFDAFGCLHVLRSGLHLELILSLHISTQVVGLADENFHFKPSSIPLETGSLTEP